MTPRARRPRATSVAPDPAAQHFLRLVRRSGYSAAEGDRDNRFKAYIGRRLRKPFHAVVDAIRGRGAETTEPFFDVRHFEADPVWYVPSGWRNLRAGLRGLEVTAADVFIDLGCGKGRVLLQAARLPFRRVLGVEISPHLADVARRNLVRARQRNRCGEVEIVTCDAADFALPDDVTIVYLAHPFTGETFGCVAANIVESLARAPRQLRLIYAIPVHEADVVATGRFDLLYRTPISDGGHRIDLAVFESKPSEPAS
jgi:SAM-dependent methyltransferase